MYRKGLPSSTLLTVINHYAGWCSETPETACFRGDAWKHLQGWRGRAGWGCFEASRSDVRNECLKGWIVGSFSVFMLDQ